MSFEYCSYSDTGRRDNNEDSHRAELTDGKLLAVVADGLGGHAKGEVASALAVGAVFDRISSASEIDEEELIYGLLDANESILASGIQGYSTAAALWLQEDYAVAAHVGDSRIYHFRNNEILFQSVDHSHVQLAVLVGEIEPHELRHHSDRNKLLRALGDPQASPKADSREIRVMSGDRFLLCSDGFWESITENQMLETLAASNSPEQWMMSMKNQVLEANDPKQDNHTAICIFVS